MSNNYDEKGNYIGQTDSNGNHWDKNGSYVGRTDSNGNHWDKNGSYVGKTDSNGDSWDRGGSYAGKNNWSGGGGNSSGSSWEDDLAGALVVLLAPILLPIVFGIMILGAAFGIPFAIFWVIDSALLNFFNIILATVLGTTFSLAFCAVDVYLIKRFYSKLTTDWKGKLTIVYMMLLLIVPWLTGATLIPSLIIEQPIPPTTVGQTSNSESGNFVMPVSPTTTATPAIAPTQKTFSNITGTWDLNFNYIGYTNSEGVFKERLATENWAVNLWQSGNIVTGELLSVNSNYVDSCMNARIEGSIKQTNLSLLVYFNGSCCPDEIAKIEGIIQNNKFIGNYQPAKTPSGTCALSTGEVTGNFLSKSDLQINQISTPSLLPTALIIPTPYMGNFSACIEPCNESNSISNFPEAITKVYIEWDYENIPYGARYTRKWTMDGKEWIRYECLWSGSENGRDSVKLTEPRGLHSGTWELTISVNDEILLREQINVSGNWGYWDPAGSLSSCYGTTD